MRINACSKKAPLLCAEELFYRKFYIFDILSHS